MAENNLMVVNTEEAKAKAVEYLSSMGLQIPEQQKKQFVELAAAFGLNPFKREIYAVGYGNNWNIITGYEVYLKRANRTGLMNGFDVTIAGSGENMSATVTIHRKDWEYPFKHTVLFSEVCQKNKEGKLTNIWAKMPSFMTKKVAMAQGFRLCFPDEMGGMPYTSDEMPEAEEAPSMAAEAIRDVTPKAQPAAAEKKLYTPEQAQELKKIFDDNPGVFSKEEIDEARKMLISQGGQKTIDLAKSLVIERTENAGNE